jgi:uncharacterized protein DUF3592
MRSTLDVVLSGITALSGFGLLVKAARDKIKSSRALTWPTAEGKVLDSRLLAVRDNRGDTWKAHVLYEYSVNGVSYRSDVLQLEAGSSSFTGGAEKTIARYPVGSVVPVYFNPESPGDAMLEPGKMTWWIFFAGICFLFGGVAALIHNLSLK